VRGLRPRGIGSNDTANEAHGFNKAQELEGRISVPYSRQSLITRELESFAAETLLEYEPLLSDHSLFWCQLQICCNYAATLPSSYHIPNIGQDVEVRAQDERPSEVISKQMMKLRIPAPLTDRSREPRSQCDRRWKQLGQLGASKRCY
jgi:hypothetical protein